MTWVTLRPSSTPRTSSIAGCTRKLRKCLGLVFFGENNSLEFDNVSLMMTLILCLLCTGMTHDNPLPPKKKIIVTFMFYCIMTWSFVLLYDDALLRYVVLDCDVL